MRDARVRPRSTSCGPTRLLRSAPRSRSSCCAGLRRGTVRQRSRRKSASWGVAPGLSHVQRAQLHRRSIGGGGPANRGDSISVAVTETFSSAVEVAPGVVIVRCDDTEGNTFTLTLWRCRRHNGQPHAEGARDGLAAAPPRLAEGRIGSVRRRAFGWSDRIWLGHVPCAVGSSRLASKASKRLRSLQSEEELARRGGVGWRRLAG
jgi:hypothetical protein